MLPFVLVSNSYIRACIFFTILLLPFSSLFPTLLFSKRLTFHHPLSSLFVTSPDTFTTDIDLPRPPPSLAKLRSLYHSQYTKPTFPYYITCFTRPVVKATFSSSYGFDLGKGRQNNYHLCFSQLGLETQERHTKDIHVHPTRMTMESRIQKNSNRCTGQTYSYN